MIVFFHFTFSFIKYLWDTYVHNQVTKDLKILFETNNKTEAFEKYENRRLNCESLGIGHNSYDHNLKWTTEDGDLFQFSDFQLNFDPAYYFENNIRFCPPVFQQRYLTIAHIINNPKWKGKIRKVVEFGCAELALLNHLKLIQGIREINLVDIDGQLLRDNVYRVQPWFCESYNFERAVPLTVNVLRGSVSHPDRYCKAVDAVIAIELIEHMYEDELSQLPQNIFGYIKPRLAIFTTPNSDFNVLFINFSGFRHDDHKFEWSRKEFEAWANNICVQYPDYEVHFIGIGPPPPGKEHLGYCSQGAVFMRVQFDADNQDCEELNTESYELIETTEFPVVEQLDPDYKTIIDAGHYIRICERHGEFQKNYKTVIPLSLILVRVYKTCKSTEKLRKILEEKYKIEENSDGEEVVVYSGEEDESDSGLDENCPTNVVQATDDQWERRSCSSWGSVRDKGESEENGWDCAESEVSAGAWQESEQVPTLVEDNLEQNCDCKQSGEIETLETGDNVDSNQFGEENWDYEASEQEKSSEARGNVDSHEYGEENWDSGEIEVPVPARPTSSVNSDASCGNLDELKEILSNLPALQPYCEPDFVFDPAQASDSNFILEDTRSVGLETIVSVSDENYESSLVSSDSLIRRTDSSSVFVMDGSHYMYNEPGEGSQWDLSKSKSLHSVGGTLVSAKSSHEVKATKSLESVTEKQEKVSEKSGDDFKSWKSLHCVSEKRIYSPGKSYSDSKALDCIESGVKTVKVLLPNTLEQQEGVGEKLKKLDCFVDKDGLVNSEKYSSNITVLPSVCDIRAGCITDDVVKGIETSTPNVSRLNGKDENDPNIREIPPSTSETRHDYVMQDLTKLLYPFQVNLDSNDSCHREEKLSIDLAEEQLLSDFDSSSSLHLHCDDVSNVCGLDNISGSTSKLPISIRNSTSSLLEESSVEEQLLAKIGSCESSNFKTDLLQPFETEISETGPEVTQSLDSVENNTCFEDQKFKEICVNSFEKKLLNPDCSTEEAETSQFEKLAQKSESTLNKLVNNSGSVEKDEQPFAEVHKCDSSSSNLTYDCDVDSSESKELLMNDGSSSRYVSDIEFDDVLSRPSLSKESELSYKSCDTSIRDKDSRGDLGNMCLPDLNGLNLSKDAKIVDSSSSGSKNNLDEARRFSSTSFIFKSQSQERIKEIYSFRSIGSEISENCKIINEGKDCDTSSPLHKCYSTGKISRGFSAYNEGVISNSCVNKLSSSLAGEPEFFDKNNDLARERRCMSVSCIGNINVDYDENSCLEERELQNSCSPDKFGPDSGYPNSSSGLDMEMDTPEQVKQIMTESESSFDESPLESPVVEEEDLPFDNNPGLHPPVIPVGENVENGDVANNNRDGEGNNMVGDGIVGDALQFHALIEENEGNLQLMGAACNGGERVSEGCKHVDQSKTSTEVLVGEIESVCVKFEGSTETGSSGNDMGKEKTEVVESRGTRSSENFAEVEETPTTSHEECLSTLDQNQASNDNVDQTSSDNCQETNNNCERRSSSCKVEQNAPSQIDLPLSGPISVNRETNNNSDQRLASSDSSQNLRSKIDQLSIRCSSSVSKNSDQGTTSGNVDENRQSLIDLPLSTCSSTTNNSTDQGYSSSHSEHNLRSQIDAPLTSTYRGKRIDQQCRIQAERDLRLEPDPTSNRCLSTYNIDESKTQLGQNRGLESDLQSTSYLSTNNSTNPGSASNLRLQSDLPSSSSSSTNNSTDLRSNVRPQSDPPSSTNNSSDLPSTSSLTTHFNSDHSSSSFHPDQNLWSHLDLPSTVSYMENNSAGLDVEELNIENVDDLNSLVPLSLVEIVLNRLMREMAEDVLLQIEIDNALNRFAAEQVLVVEVNDQDPTDTDFMGGGDSAAENM
ncbi:serine-rich adhesin for platelets [Nilaparvata lugens]|uniref:serine-rich adhesin for platelets n=1 Tax=Nilaparvata lugens TaxID=108931 RepID=UPI00193D03AD|nr:serine-rich adhesin for platelets [Nilaparvata lugens]